jgi:hypothetical protein
MDALVQQLQKYIIPDGSAQKPYMTRRGELFGMDWIQAAILEGRGFIFNAGAFSTPVVGGGAGTIIDNDQPEVGILIPSGTTIVPFRVHVQLTTPLLAADSDEAETVFYADTTAATAALALDGTWTNTVTPKNMRVAATNVNTSECTVKTLCTADTTEPTETIDLFHSVILADLNGTAANALWTRHDVLYEPKNPLYIVGPALVFGYWGGTVATNAFLQFAYLEFPTTQVS